MKTGEPNKIVEYKGFGDDKGKVVEVKSDVIKVKLSDSLSGAEIQKLLIEKSQSLKNDKG